MKPALHVQGLSKAYKDVQALQGVDLTVHQGEVFGFLGANGAGKTTFTKCITGFVRPDSGTVRLMGIDSLRESARAAQHVGLVPDQYDFYPHMTGRQHLDYYGRLCGLPAAVRRKRIAQVLELVRMTDRADRKVKGYSHGMKQRICIGQAIMHKPRLVILDEPTNGLDPQGAYELRQIMRKLAATGITIFLNSHQLAEVEQVCDRVAIISAGKVQVVDTVERLRRRFAKEPEVSVRVLNPGPAIAHAVQSVAGEVAAAKKGIYTFHGAPEMTAAVVAAIVGAGGQIAGVSRDETSLEDVFLQVTGGA